MLMERVKCRPCWVCCVPSRGQTVVTTLVCCTDLWRRYHVAERLGWLEQLPDSGWLPLFHPRITRRAQRVFVPSLRACDQSWAKASTFKLAHQNVLLICLSVQLSSCLAKCRYRRLSSFFFFFLKLNRIGLNGFCICLSRCAAVGRLRQSVHVFFCRPSFFVSWSVNKVQAEERRKKCGEAKQAKSHHLTIFIRTKGESRQDVCVACKT